MYTLTQTSPSLQKLHTMGYRPLEIEIQSAQGLKHVNRFKKMKTYAVVFICDNNNNPSSSEKKTAVNKNRGSDPSWNFLVKFNIHITKKQKKHHALVVKLKSQHKMRSDKDIAEVRVPITELLAVFDEADAAAAAEEEDDDDDDDDDDDEKKQVKMSKSVVTSDGTGEVTLSFSYEFGTTLQHPPADPPLVPKKSLIQKVKKAAVKAAGAVAAALALGGVEQLASDVVHDSE